MAYSMYQQPLGLAVCFSGLIGMPHSSCDISDGLMLYVIDV